MSELKIAEAAAVVLPLFRFTTDCMNENSTTHRLKNSKKRGFYSDEQLKRIREITTRLEEIHLLISVYKLKACYGVNMLATDLGDHLQKRTRSLVAEYESLRNEAVEFTIESLVSKTQALANWADRGWFAPDS